MNDIHTRSQQLRSFTRKKWAEAVGGLHRAEERLAKKRAEFTQTCLDMRAATKTLEANPALGRVLGSSLQMDATARDIKRSQLERLEARERELAGEIARAESCVDKAKDEVAKAHNALKHLSA